MASCCDSKTAPEEDEEEDMDGPLEDRSCTDIIFLAFFAAFLIGMFILFGLGVERGDPHRLIQGVDVAGNVCGRSNDPINISSSGQSLTGKDYLYYDWVRTAKILGDESINTALTSLGVVANFTELLGAGQVYNSDTDVARDFCVQEAYKLTSKLRRGEGGAVLLSEQEEVHYSEEDKEVSTLPSNMRGIVISKQVLKNDTSVVALLQTDGSIRVWRTSKVTGSDANQLLSNDLISDTLSGGKVCRYCVETCPDDLCVPKLSGGGSSSLLSGTGIQSFANDLAQDFQVCQSELAQMGITALGLSVLMTIAFRFLAGLIVYAIIALVVVALVTGTIALWVIWWLKKTDMAERSEVLDSLDTTQLSAAQNVTQSLVGGVSTAKSQEEVTFFLVAAIMATIITVVILIVLFVLRKRIGLVVALFHEAGKAVHAMPYLVLIPLLTFVSLALTTAIWLYASLWIVSAGEPEVDPVTSYVKFVPDSLMYWMRWYHVMGFLWITQFCIACQHLVIAGSVAGWYFTKDKGSVGVQTVISAFWRLVRFHLGTAAFGSFIIALIQLVRIILAYIEHLVKKYEKKGFGTAGKVALVILKAVLACLQCILACFERFMKFINVNAYIETAIYGYNFCRAAMKAFKLLMANALRVAAINSIGTFVLFLGKIVVVIATGVISYYILKDNKEVQYFWPQIFVSVLFAYLIAHTFIGVYEMAIDTIFLCFCEDSARNDGINKPYYMSKDLMHFVENSGKALEAMDKRNEVKQNEAKHMMVQERRYSEDSIAMVDVD